MNRHFIKPVLLTAVMFTVVFSLMALEAKSEPLDIRLTAYCYAAASIAGDFDEAKRQRLILRPYQDNNDIVYYIGYAMGYITAVAEAHKLEAESVAKTWLKTYCLRKTK